MYINCRPTTLDIYVASHILLLLDAPFPDLLLQSLLKESYPTLTAHARLIHLRALPTTGSDIPVRPPQGYSLGSLIPWPVTRLARKPKPKQKTAEDIRFDRLRWGWIALAAFSAALYIAQTGFRVKVVQTATLVGEENETLEEFEVEGEVEEE
jgi:sorting and assembly machinery component 37